MAALLPLLWAGVSQAHFTSLALMIKPSLPLGGWLGGSI